MEYKILFNRIKSRIAVSVGVLRAAFVYGTTYVYGFSKEETLAECLERLDKKRKYIHKISRTSSVVEEAIKKSLYKYALHTLELEGEKTGSEEIAGIIRGTEYAEKNIEIGSMNIDHLRGIHGNLFRDDPQKCYMAGQLRNHEVEVSGVDGLKYNPTPYLEVEHRLVELVNRINTKKNIDQKEIILLAANLKLEFLLIHPFLDGNGRTSRALFNALLRKAGYPWIIFPLSEKYEYFKGISAVAEGGNEELFLRYIVGCIERSMDQYIKDL